MTRLPRMKYVFQIALSVLFCGLAKGQSTNQDRYQRAKLYLEDHSIIKASKLVIQGEEASFFNSDAREAQELPLGSIALIRVPKGSHILEGALFGAGTLALTALLVDLQPDALGIEREKGADFYLGYTAVGASIGAVVGLLFPKWKLLYSEGRFLSGSVPLQLGITSQQRTISLKLKLVI